MVLGAPRVQRRALSQAASDRRLTLLVHPVPWLVVRAWATLDHAIAAPG